MRQIREALVIRGPGRLELETRDVPDLSDSDVIVDVEFGGICGSDLHYWRHGTSGTSVLREPMILGHEVVGRVGREAQSGSGPSVGVAVAVYPAVMCGTCEQCRAGRRNLCVSVKYMGSAAHLPHTDGGFASQIVVPQVNLRVLPDSVPLERFALVEPASVAWHAVNRAGPVVGARTLVVGAGPIGLAVVAILRLRGAAHIAVSDLHPRPLETALRLGADDAMLSGAIPDSKTESGYDAAFECSGSAPGLAQAMEKTRGGGRVVMVGNQGVDDIPFSAARAISKELQVNGSYRFDGEFDEVISAISSGALDLTPIVSGVFDWHDFLDAFESAADASASSKVLLAISSRTGHHRD